LEDAGVEVIVSEESGMEDAGSDEVETSEEPGRDASEMTVDGGRTDADDAGVRVCGD
jgi:hypothetical protein